MNYKRIRCNECKEVDSILIKVAEWHSSTPSQWMGDYEVAESEIQETVDRLKITHHDDLYLAVSENTEKQITGFIWGYKQRESADTVMILSLYVVEEYRKSGVASRLKSMLEEWCYEEKIKSIHTTVHYTNKKMITLNEKLGYEPGMLVMKKRL